MRPGGYSKMSIIIDALKKAQAKLTATNQNQNPQSNPTPGPNPNPSQEVIQKDGKDITKIYEKLGQLNQQRNESRPSSLETAKSKQPEEKKKKTTLSQIGLLLILIGALGVVFYQWFMHSSVTTRRNILAKIPTIKKSPTVAPPLRIYDKDALVLSGTMMMGDKRVALINNDIYELGDIINGKKITSISLEKVELLDNDKVVTLTVKSGHK